MKRLFVVLGLIMGLVATAFGYWKWGLKLTQPTGEREQEAENYLEKYDFDNLKKRGGKVSKIEFGGEPEGVCIRRKEVLENIDSRVFYFYSDGKKISGMVNIPNPEESRKKPAIIMIRGYADKSGYYVGSGSWRMADKLAENGFVTFSIDFLGFGESDAESLDMMEARFEKVPTVLDLIESVKEVGFVDENNIGIWAHSNGGQIALSVLEITSGNYPTSLWAPMTNPFPKSVLDTASGLDDGGKAVIKAINNFEKHHDSRRYAFENYYDWVAAPIVIHQGTADAWCEVTWQEEVVEGLRAVDKEVMLYVYSNDDHNLSGNWEEVAEGDVLFYKKNLIN
ncbi:MAG: alpha/beta hydrolase family protein [Patescibacteria group bacterium]|jgi:dipeptidyl aminopeptidase/acylaminoacyl peptidase